MQLVSWEHRCWRFVFTSCLLSATSLQGKKAYLILEGQLGPCFRVSLSADARYCARMHRILRRA